MNNGHQHLSSVTLDDCSSHTIPDDQLGAFLRYILDDNADNATNDVISAAAEVLGSPLGDDHPGRPLALATVKALSLSDVMQPQTAVLYACWTLAGMPGYVELTDRGAYPRATDPQRAVQDVL